MEGEGADKRVITVTPPHRQKLLPHPPPQHENNTLAFCSQRPYIMSIYGMDITFMLLLITNITFLYYTKPEDLAVQIT